MKGVFTDSAMKDPTHLLGKLNNSYRAVCLIIVNSILLFLLINLLAAGYLNWKSNRQKVRADANAPFAHREYHSSLAPLYPGMNKGQVSELIKETRKISQEYDAYTQFKERPTNGTYVNVDPNGFRV
ncbi:MAG TPA: hypothetical protein VK463_19830, partial [Desulfomonilaceae bacterium]|nr:hypothetical protein [Desulfomonilaceae bacterium]